MHLFTRHHLKLLGGLKQRVKIIGEHPVHLLQLDPEKLFGLPHEHLPADHAAQVLTVHDDGRCPFHQTARAPEDIGLVKQGCLLARPGVGALAALDALLLFQLPDQLAEAAVDLGVGL